MGGGIALSLALAGRDVRLWGRRADGVAAARARVAADAAFMVEEGLVDGRAAERAVARSTSRRTGRIARSPAPSSRSRRRRRTWP